MGVTISTHRGRGSESVHRGHNRREEHVVEKEEHIIKGGTYEIWIDEDPRSAYERLFGKSVAEYNANQKREDRQIKDYYEKVKGSKDQQPVYEMIIGIYGKHEDGTPICSDEKGKEIMKEFVENWQKRNPKLELIGAYYHADEVNSAPHVHIDYVPIADGYTKGMKVRTGATKAFEQMGFESDNSRSTGLMKWSARENDYFTKLCESHGLEVDHPREEGRKHMAKNQWREKKALEAAEKAEKHLETLEGRIVEADKLVKETIGTDFLGRAKDKVTMSRQEFLDLHKTASSVKSAESFEMSAIYHERMAQETMREAEHMKAEYEDKLKHMDSYIADKAVNIYHDELEQRLNDRNLQFQIEKRELFMQKYSVGNKSILELFKEECERQSKALMQSIERKLGMNRMKHSHDTHDFDIGDDDGR